MTYNSTDTGATLIVSLVNADGTARDLTAATAITLVGVVVGTDKSVTRTGAIYGTATNGQCSFTPMGTIYTPTAPRYRATLEFYVKWTQGGLQYWSLQSFRRDIVVFP